ncbi:MULTISPECIES: hypothetical protein [unclassified Rathayibacter]|uniref:hypothetical protein n=1 Tax=unclassified Rathayibacter TaxID=2609250 RepID=UPI0006F8B1A0|nr:MULTISPECIES: hypothetical protein [unclassified Rathayibacter]KQQ06245.1 hypothetical protein ASF42_06965 [Rathayibacter sp. Leaf294]KQS14100.1 hypothetical protein ASG06_06965 [Rathayibacter sp. Leaf185]
MERIHYAGSSVLTGTAIARALVRYAEALALRKGSMTVEIPVRRASGGDGRASLLIGPASQLFSESEEGGGDEIVDDELVARLTREADGLGVSRPITETDSDEGAMHVPDFDIPHFHDDEGAR